MKRITLPLLAGVLAIAASAFTTLNDTHYFRFNGGASDDLLDPANYTYLGTSPGSSGCSDGSVNCLIEMSVAPDANNRPDFQAAGITTESQVDAITEAWKQ